MRDGSEQKASTQDPKFMTITKFAWEEKVQQVKALESKVEEMQKTINTFPVYCKLDEDIPDDDKEAAYKMGYADAIADIAESIKALKGGETK